MNTEFDLSSFQGTTSLYKATELIEHISKDMFISTDTGISNRTINHWEQVGLIDNTRIEGQRWRRFSFLEYVWIKIIEQLRNIGLPIDTIREAKGWLFEPIPAQELWRMIAEIPGLKENISARLPAEEQADVIRFLEESAWEEMEEEYFLNMLQLLIADVVTKRLPISLVVFADGETVPVVTGEEAPDDIAQMIAYKTHVRVSLTGILKDFLKGELAEARIGQLHILQPAEARLLEMIHSGEYQSVTIKFKDKKMASLDLVKSQDVTMRIVDVLAESNYQDISIKTHEGMVTKIENTIKVRL